LVKKECQKCLETKSILEFGKDKRKKDGRNSWCKTCINALSREKSSKRVFSPTVFGEKVCSDCGVLKAVFEFYPFKHHTDGLSSYCRECDKRRKKIYKESVDFPPDLSVIKVCSKCGILKEAQDYYACRFQSDGLESACKECSNLRVKTRREGLDFKHDPEGMKYCPLCGLTKSSKDFYKERTSTDGLDSCCKACFKERKKEYFRNNHEIHIRQNIRRRLHYFIKLGADVSADAAIDFMGCTVTELKSYLESLFYRDSKSGREMSWDNYGIEDGTKGWDIDHIIPLAKVSLEDPKQLAKVCNFKNLQPMWNWENERKSSSLPEGWILEEWIGE
jgi:hypothetical protein